MPVPDGAGATPYQRVYPGERLARDHRMPAVSSAAGIISKNGSILTPVFDSERPVATATSSRANEDVTDKHEADRRAVSHEPPASSHDAGWRLDADLFWAARSRAAAQARVHASTDGEFAPLPIAIPNFVAGTPADGEVGVGVTQVITNNLKRSGLFAPIDQAAYHRESHQHRRRAEFQNWKTINAQALVTGRMTRQGDGRLKAEFRLWDVNTGQQLAGQQYFTSPEYWRRIAHIISDQIYERLTGEKGYFDSRVVFVDETGSKERRVKRLALMDQDGANVRYLTRGADLVLTPRFSPSTQEITYMEFGQGDPRVYLFNIETGQREIVGNFPGMSFSPRFSPDGQRVIMSLQQGGNSNLFVMDLRSKSTTRLTDTPAIDTSPSYSPDGTKHLLRIRSRRQAADLCDAGDRRRGAAHLLRRGQLLDAGVVAARRLHRLHQAGRRPVRHRHHEDRRLGRAHPHLGLSTMKGRPSRRTAAC